MDVDSSSRAPFPCKGSPYATAAASFSKRRDGKGVVSSARRLVLDIHIDTLWHSEIAAPVLHLEPDQDQLASNQSNIGKRDPQYRSSCISLLLQGHKSLYSKSQRGAST